MARHRERFGRRLHVETLESRQMFAGSLDPSFSGDGKVTLSTPGDLHAGDVALQSDGKTVVVGLSSINNSGVVSNQFAISRFNFDGTLDTAFAQGGIARVSLGPRDNAFPQAVAIAPDGKIVVVGWAFMSRNANDTDIAVVRYLPSGVLDTTFSGDGKLTIDLNESEIAGTKARDVAIEPDGQIVIVGESFDGETDDLFVTRLNVNGSVNGTRFMEFGEEDSAEAVKIDASGRIYVVGNITKRRTVHDPIVQRVALARFLPGRSTDYQKLFSIPGYRSTVVDDLILQPGGKFIITGEAIDEDGSRDIYVARFTDTGELDPTFGQSGYRLTDVEVDLDPRDGDSVSGITRSPFGAGGFMVSGAADGQMMVLKYTDDGRLDNTFGANGVARVPGFRSAAKIAVGPGLRVTLAGGEDFATARMLLDGARVVTAASFDSLAVEGSTNTATLFVGRTERLPVPTRVFFSVGGAASFSSTRANTRDYSLPGMIFPTTIGGLAFVDIPANQTFVLLTLTTVNDSLREGNESASFTIVANSNYQIDSHGSGTITIGDDDTPSSRVGTTRVAAPPRQVRVAEELRAAVTWTVPTGGWRQLSTIQLRVRDLHDQNVFAILTFDESRNAFSVKSTSAAGAGLVSLILSKCTFEAAGPSAPIVKVIFTFRFNEVAAKRRFALDVAATNDIGAFSGFAQVSDFLVHKKRSST